MKLCQLAGSYNIAPDMVLFFFNQKVLTFFLFLHENICFRYSLEAPCQGASNEYPQHMFSWRNKKKYFPDNPSCLELCYNTLIIIE